MKLRSVSTHWFLTAVLLQSVFAQQDKQKGGLNDLSTPGLKAELSVGFNYDYLRSPLRVDYKKAKGLFGINIPIAIKPNAETSADLMGNISKNFTDGEYFAPSLAVKQFANTTLQVDVPFYGGVLEWSHMRMMNIKYKNQLGLPNFTYKPDSLPGAGSIENVDISLLLTGNMSVPVGFDLGWETMTFGYAYNFKDQFQVALNLSRHYFYVDLLGDVDINILGKINIETSQSGVSVDEQLDPNYSLQSNFDGFYDLKRWTPTIATSWTPTFRDWKTGFQFIGRFGFTKNAEGSLYGGYAVPFFVDPQTFKIEALSTEYISENMAKFKNSETSKIEFKTSNDMLWSMPNAYTFGWDIVASKLNLSYTKLQGSVRMELVDKNFQKGTEEEQIFDTLDVRIGAHVDHMIMLQGHFPRIYFNFGIFSFDVDFGDKKNIINSSSKDSKGMIPFGDGVMLPIASGGIILGDKTQVKVEGHLAPFPALNTGIIYHF